MKLTSWEDSHKWYDSIVGEMGHYYHEHVILPRVTKMLSLENGDSLLDLGCGQGVLSRHLALDVDYVGVDAAPSLIQEAKRRSKRPFFVGDITKPLSIKHAPFSHATLILVLQNVDDPESTLKHAADALKPGGKLLIVLNHPCFRIPRQSSWGVDEDKKLQYRRIDRYFTPLKIPIQTNPGNKEKSAETWSFHHPLSTYIQWLAKYGFMVKTLEEWLSDKQSRGGKAKMENRSRDEFPLFLTILAEKTPA